MTDASHDPQAAFTRAVDTADAAAFGWGCIQWLASGQIFPGADITFGYTEIKAGKKNPRHYHARSDEVLYLLEGELAHSVGDEMVHMTPGMVVHIPKGVPHDARNTGTTTAKTLIAFSTGDREAVFLETGDDY